MGRRFNPHPPLRADAMPRYRSVVDPIFRFNPHPPLRADAMSVTEGPDCLVNVSILTRPYGRMLSSLSLSCISRAAVSILTRPYGRMLYEWVGSYGVKGGFNPHPPLRADAIGNLGLILLSRFVFQSSPALTGGCYMMRLFLFLHGLWRFNPHPPLRADAMRKSA